MQVVLLQISWRRGSKDSRGHGFKGLFSKDFISAFNINPKPLSKYSNYITLICATYGGQSRPCLSSFGNVAVILYISKQSSYDFCQTFKSL